MRAVRAVERSSSGESPKCSQARPGSRRWCGVLRRGVAAARVEAVEDLARELGGERAPVSELKATTRMRAPSSARTLLWTRSAIDVQGALVGELDVVVLGALAQDRQARGEVGGRDVGDEAGLEALAQAVLERLQIVGRAVGGEHDLAAAVVQGVEGVEELLLGLGLALEELDVVEQQHVDVAEAGLKVSVRPPPSAPRNSFVKASPVVQRTVRPGLCESSRLAIELSRWVLPTPGRTADEQRVVGLGWHLRDGQRGGVREAVAVADDELVERQLGVAERARSAAGGERARRRARRRPAAASARRGGAALAGALDRRGGSSTLDVCAENELDARLDHAPEALADPAAGVRRALRRAGDRRRARAARSGSSQMR